MYIDISNYTAEDLSELIGLIGGIMDTFTGPNDKCNWASDCQKCEHFKICTFLAKVLDELEWERLNFIDIEEGDDE